MVLGFVLYCILRCIDISQARNTVQDPGDDLLIRYIVQLTVKY